MGRANKDHRESRGAGLRPLVLQVTWNLLLKELLSAVRAGKLKKKKGVSCTSPGYGSLSVSKRP